MPRPWVSVRGQKDKSGIGMTSSKGQVSFDFAFLPDSGRPVTAAGQQEPTEQTPSPARYASRPKTSGDSQLGGHRVSDLHSEDCLIGVAFGSPTHQPPGFQSLLDVKNPPSLDHPFRHQGPLPAQVVQGKKWKKFGDLFKARSTPPSSPNRSQATEEPISSALIHRKDLDVSPVRRTPSLTDAAPSRTQSGVDRTEATPILDQHEDLDLPSSKRLPSALPRLEIEIPSTRLERYSVMFEGIGNRSAPSLVTRKSETDDSLQRTLGEEKDSRPVAAGTDERIHLLPQNAASPTVAKLPVSQSSPPKKVTASSNYFLFPSHPTSTKAEQNAVTTIARPRSVTVPSLLLTEKSSSPADHADGPRVSPSKDEAESCFTSPENATASTGQDDFPWRSVESLKSTASSRTSVDEEIFFDVKPVKDPTGSEDEEFVVTRPDSTAVQLARSASNARKKTKVDLTPSPDSQASGKSGSSRTSIEIDETIAAVEKFVSQSSADMPPFVPTSSLPSINLNRLEVASLSSDVRPTRPLSALKPRKLKKTRLDGLDMGIPSPVTEATDESASNSIVSLEKAMRAPSPLLPTNKRHVAATTVDKVSRGETSRCARNVSELSAAPSIAPPTPPKPPKKDLRYIPLSKYAPAQTSTTLTARTGIRSLRSGRSASEDTAIPSPRTDSLPKRSSTLPSLSLDMQMAGGPTLPTKPIQLSSPVSPETEAVPELSIARTISLSRKTSTKILVPRMSGRGDGQESQLLVPGAQTLSTGQHNGIEKLHEKRALSPQFHEPHHSHKPGVSMNLIVEHVVQPSTVIE